MSTQPDWAAARIVAIDDLTPDIRQFTLAREGPFVAPTPGSHVQLRVLIDGRPANRSYSVVGACRDGLYRIAVKALAQSRGGSRYMWSLAPGERLEMSSPANHCDLGYGAADYVLVAGGIGITPIYGMALALAAGDAPLRMLYAARTQADLAFVDDLRDSLGARLETHVAADGARIDLAAVIATMHPEGEMYVCGPIGLLEDAKRCWQAAGRPPERLRFETFGNSGRFAAMPFQVRIPRLDMTVDVAANQSLLEALEQADIAMLSDCRRGECGLCVLPILTADGTIDHRDVFFSDAQKARGDRLCTCVSRLAGGVLTLDVPGRSRAA